GPLGRPGGVVDEYVETAKRPAEVGGDGAGARIVGDVQRPRVHLALEAGQPGRGVPRFVERARRENHGPAVGGELPAHLEADAARGPGHQGDGLFSQAQLPASSAPASRGSAPVAASDPGPRELLMPISWPTAAPSLPAVAPIFPAPRMP